MDDEPHDPEGKQTDQVELTRAGYVVLLGYPNAGKSSLLNRLLDQKLSIVSPLPQTTRERVVGIDTREGGQMIFIDTPGLVDPRYLLHASMRHAALQAISEADVAVLLVDLLQPLPSWNVEPLPRLRERSGTAVVALNKTDVATSDQVGRARVWAEDAGVIHLEISAATGAGVEQLRQTITRLLPASPFLYPPDEISSQPVRFFVAEFVRETIFERYKDEIPYSVAVRVDEYREASTPIYIRATIFVERASQKGILIGARGTAIRDLGQAARQKVEAFVQAQVFLDLWVKVLPRWRKDAGALRHLGYPLPPTGHA